MAGESRGWVRMRQLIRFTAAAITVVVMTACAGEVTLEAGAISTPAATAAPSTATTATSPPTTGLPLPPEDAAALAFGVWVSGDLDRLADLMTGSAFVVLAGRAASEMDRWRFVSCASALGRTNCAWTGTTETLALHVDNKAAEEGRPAVTYASFKPAP